MPSFSTSLSGLNAEEQALSVVSNNLANMNTTAFKSQTPIFSDLFYQQVGSNGAGDPVQIGVGVTVSSVASPFTQGNIQSTGVSTDAAIQGDGFFILDKDGSAAYTRAGNFTLDPGGHLIDSSGAYVMGYPSADGKVNANQALAPIVISKGQTSAPQKTTEMQLNMNLNAAASLPIAATGGLSMTGNAADGETIAIGGTTYTFKTALSTPVTVADEVLIGLTPSDTLANLRGAINQASTGGQVIGTTYSAGTVANTSATATGTTATTLTLQAIGAGLTGNTITTTSGLANGTFGSANLTGGLAGETFSTPMTVFDTLGTSHVLNFSFTKVSSGDWSYQITVPAADIGATGNPQVVESGNLQFNSSGTLISPPSNVAGISIPNLADGAAGLNLTWKVFNSSGTPFITQLAGSSAASDPQQDGHTSGTLQTYSINGDGMINGILSNGQTVALGQIALATFPNSEGLSRIGSNSYQGGLSSGLPSVGTPGAGGRGALKGGALEQSNVDIATEFTQLIVAERGYQANAKAITTADTVMQTAINLKN